MIFEKYCLNKLYSSKYEPWEVFQTQRYFFKTIPLGSKTEIQWFFQWRQWCGYTYFESKVNHEM